MSRPRSLGRRAFRRLLVKPVKRRVAQRRAARRRHKLAVERAWQPVRTASPKPKPKRRRIGQGQIVPWSEFGITDAQRRHAQRVLKPIRHGTNGGYHAHRARGEAACQACKRAHAAYNRRTERRASA